MPISDSVYQSVYSFKGTNPVPKEVLDTIKDTNAFLKQYSTNGQPTTNMTSAATNQTPTMTGSEALGYQNLQAFMMQQQQQMQMVMMLIGTLLQAILAQQNGTAPTTVTPASTTPTPEGNGETPTVPPIVCSMPAIRPTETTNETTAETGIQAESETGEMTAEGPMEYADFNSQQRLFSQLFPQYFDGFTRAPDFKTVFPGPVETGATQEGAAAASTLSDAFNLTQ